MCIGRCRRAIRGAAFWPVRTHGRIAEVKQTVTCPNRVLYHITDNMIFFGIFLDLFDIFKALSAFYALAMNLFKFELQVQRKMRKGVLKNHIYMLSG